MPNLQAVEELQRWYFWKERHNEHLEIEEMAKNDHNYVMDVAEMLEYMDAKAHQLDGSED